MNVLSACPPPFLPLPVSHRNLFKCVCVNELANGRMNECLDGGREGGMINCVDAQLCRCTHVSACNCVDVPLLRCCICVDVYLRRRVSLEMELCVEARISSCTDV